MVSTLDQAPIKAAAPFLSEELNQTLTDVETMVANFYGMSKQDPTFLSEYIALCGFLIKLKERDNRYVATLAGSYLSTCKYHYENNNGGDLSGDKIERIQYAAES